MSLEARKSYLPDEFFIMALLANLLVGKNCAFSAFMTGSAGELHVGNIAVVFGMIKYRSHCLGNSAGTEQKKKSEQVFYSHIHTYDS